MKHALRLLLNIALLLAFGNLASGRTTAKIVWLSYSPDGRYLAVLKRDKGVGGQLSVMRQPAGRGPTVELGDCDSQTAAFAGPGRVAYCAQRQGKFYFVAQSLQNPHQVTRSQPLAVSAVGALSARGDLVACVAKDGARFKLLLFNLASGRLRQWALPKAFAPAWQQAPVISRQGRVIAVVNTQGSYFLGLKVNSGAWLAPVTVGGSKWAWRVVEAKPIDPKVWHVGYGFKSEKFLVDEKADYLWVGIVNLPIGAIPVPREGHYVHPPTDELAPLDLDRTDAYYSKQGDPSEQAEPVKFPGIWLDYLHAVSAPANLQKIAVQYENSEHDDVLLYFLAHMRGRVVIGDRSTQAGLLAISPDGRSLAIVRVKDAVQQLETINLQ